MATPTLPHNTMRSQRTKMAKSGLLKPAATKGDEDEVVLPIVACGDKNTAMRNLVAEGDRDLVLEILEPGTHMEHLYLVSSAILRKASSYFRVLLDPEKFQEGISFDINSNLLLKEHGNLLAIPPADLPRVKLTDFGPTPRKPKLMDAMTLFLWILHNPDRPYGMPGMHGFALLTIIADRFDTVGEIAGYIHRMNWREELFNWNPCGDWGMKQEVETRQLLLAGLLLKIEPGKFKGHTANLIIRGSVRWKTDAAKKDNLDALWWNLPYHLEEELMSRRDYLLDTVASVQTYFIKIFAFQPNQCRLGYDTSPACNSFQLGEMVRFFARKGTLNLQSTIFPTEQPIPWEGDVDTLISSLRQIPSYQIDSNHMHCGPKNRLLTALNTLQPFPQIGICWQCWQKNSHEESWLENPSGGKWAINTWKPNPVIEPQGCTFHRKTKAMYTAEKRDWTVTEATR